MVAGAHGLIALANTEAYYEKELLRRRARRNPYFN